MSDSYTARTKYDDRVAERYLKKAERRRGPENAIFCDIMARLPRPRVLLDAPCGVGRVVDVLQDPELPYLGVDLSESMLKLAAERGKASAQEAALFLRGDVEHLPFGNSSFETTVSLRFLHHLPEETRRRVLIELARVTETHLVVTFFHPFALHFLSRKVQDLFRGKKNPRFSNTTGWMNQILQGCGFELKETHSTGFLRETWYAVYKRQSAA